MLPPGAQYANPEPKRGKCNQGKTNSKTAKQKVKQNCRRRKEAGGGGKRLSLASPSCTTTNSNLGSPVTTNAIMTSSAASTNYQQLPNSSNNYSSCTPPLSPIPHRFCHIMLYIMTCNNNDGFGDQMMWVMLNVSGTELAEFLPSSQGKCPSSPQATSTARSEPCSTLFYLNLPLFRSPSQPS